MALEKLHYFICIIMICVHLSAGSTPRSGEEIKENVLAGRNTTVPCIFEGNPLTVAWLKGERLPGKAIARYVDSRIIYPGNTTKYSVQKHFSSRTSSFPLTIAEVEIADTGRYRCAVTDLNGAFNSKLFKKNYNIKILVPPKLPYPRITPMIPDSDGGQPINLTCRADGGSIGLAKLYWMNNDTRHIQQEMVSYPNADGTTENVTSVIEAYPSEKPYTCVATLNGHESRTASVNIRPLHGTTPRTPASIPTVTTTSTGRHNKTTTDDTGSDISLAAKLWIAFGVILLIAAVLTIVIIAVHRKRNPKAIQQSQRQRNSIGSPRSPSQSSRENNENEEAEEML